MRRLVTTAMAAVLIALAVGLMLHGHPSSNEVPALKPFDPMH
jgi:hypothetical protein